MFLLVALLLVIPLGLDLYMPVPEDNPLTPEKIELGRRNAPALINRAWGRSFFWAGRVQTLEAQAI